VEWTARRVQRAPQQRPSRKDGESRLDEPVLVQRESWSIALEGRLHVRSPGVR
jgi:hypothetical protein